jgi:hypothetical protein
MSLRKYSPLVFGLMWVVGYVALAPIAYAFPQWRALLIGKGIII